MASIRYLYLAEPLPQETFFITHCTHEYYTNKDLHCFTVLIDLQFHLEMVICIIFVVLQKM